MRCPECGSDAAVSSMLDTRHRETVHRFRHCDWCGLLFRTVERAELANWAKVQPHGSQESAMEVEV